MTSLSFGPRVYHSHLARLDLLAVYIRKPEVVIMNRSCDQEDVLGGPSFLT